MSDYKILKHNNSVVLEMKVNTSLNDGYYPHGDLLIVPMRDFSGFRYIQAMIKYTSTSSIT